MTSRLKNKNASGIFCLARFAIHHKERPCSMNTKPVLPVTPDSPLLMRRIQEKPQASHPTASHMTVCTTSGNQPEMHDQSEDMFRHDQDLLAA